MTEEEAKTKLCPHSGTFNANAPWPWSSVEQEEYPARCAASECMAWRVKDYLSVPDVSIGSVHVANGYCGLSGVPQ